MLYFLELFIAGAVAGSLYALVALAFVVVYKATRVVNFALGELVMFATGFVAIGLHKLGAGLLGSLGVGLVGMTGLALAFNYGVLRFLIGRPLIAFIMVTIAFGAVLRAIAGWVFAGVPQSVKLPFPEEPVFVGKLFLSPHELLVGVVALITVGFVSWYFMRSRAGLALRAIADDERAATAMGVSLPRYFTLTWALAGAVTVVGGVLWTYITGGGFSLVMVGLKILPIVIIGGLESISGVLIGAMLIGVLEGLTAGYIDPWAGAPVSGIIAYFVLIFVLCIRPNGLFGERTIERV